MSAVKDRMTVAEYRALQTKKQGKRRGEMNPTEAAYAREVLDVRKAAGEVYGYWYESIKLRLANGAWYTPDFAVHVVTRGPHGINRRWEFHEVKGHWREAARVRIKVASDRYPFRFIAVQKLKKKDGGGWKFEEF